MPAGAEDGKRHERKYQGVEPGDHRRAGDTGVAKHLRNADRRGAGARQYIAQHPAVTERPDTAKEPYGHGRSVAARGRLTIGKSWLTVSHGLRKRIDGTRGSHPP